MGKSKKSKACSGGDDLLDNSDADIVGFSSNALSDLSISYATEHINSQEFVLNKYIDSVEDEAASEMEVEDEAGEWDPATSEMSCGTRLPEMERGESQE